MWAEYADELTNYIAAHPSGPHIIVIQFAKTQENYNR